MKFYSDDRNFFPIRQGAGRVLTPTGTALLAAGFTTPARLFAIRRLRDRPDLKSAVISGRLSPHKALTEAKLRRKYVQAPADDVGDALGVLVRHYGLEAVQSAFVHLRELGARKRSRSGAPSTAGGAPALRPGGAPGSILEEGTS